MEGDTSRILSRAESPAEGIQQKESEGREKGSVLSFTATQKKEKKVKGLLHFFTTPGRKRLKERQRGREK